MKKKLQYPFHISPLSQEDGGGYMITFPDLPGCISDGDSIEETIHNGAQAMQEWLDACKKLKRPIPKPGVEAAQSSYSGKILQRFPKTLHARLAQRAKREGVSLNQLILSLVSEGMGQRA